MHYFLNKKKKLVPCELVKTTAGRRMVRVDWQDGTKREIGLHPDGVAWGNLYPRLFECDFQPKGVFVTDGRALLIQPDDESRSHHVPAYRDHRFQPFMSKVAEGVIHNEATMLVGGTGAGKTTSVVQLGNRINQPVIRINFNGETRMSDFLGKMQVVNGETKWQDGVLPMAMRLGYWLILDEIDFADPAVLSILHPVIEEDPVLVLKENHGEVIRPHKNFRVFGTANSVGSMQDRAAAYAGTNVMNEAFLDRWNIVFVPDLPAIEEFKVIKSAVPSIRTKWAKGIVSFANMLRDQNSADANGISLGEDTFSVRRSINWAKKTALYGSPKKAAAAAWMGKIPTSEHDVIFKLIDLHFTPSKSDEREMKKKTRVRKVK